MKNETEEITNPDELEQNPKNSFWQKPKLPLYFAFSCLIFVVILSLFLVVIDKSSEKKEKLIVDDAAGTPTTIEPDRDISEENAFLKEHYYSQELFFVPWGDGECEVGLLERLESGIHGGEVVEAQRTYGPGNFEVDSDRNIYILDRINKRVLKYNENGQCLRTVPISIEGDAYREISQIEDVKYAAIKLGDMKVKDGFIYIYLSKEVEGVEDFKRIQGEIRKYNIAGDYIDTYEIPDDIEFGSIAGGPPTFKIAGPPLAIDDDGSVRVAVVQEANAIRFCRIHGEPDCYFGFRSRVGDAYYNVPHSSWFIEGCVFRGGGKIKRSGTILERTQDVEINFDGCRENICHCYFVGTDLERNIYFGNIQTVKGSKSGELVENFIGKASEKGDLLAKIDISEIPASKKKVEVAEDGDVYLLVEMEDGIKFMKYTPVESSGIGNIKLQVSSPFSEAVITIDSQGDLLYEEESFAQPDPVLKTESKQISGDELTNLHSLILANNLVLFDNENYRDENLMGASEYTLAITQNEEEAVVRPHEYKLPGTSANCPEDIIEIIQKIKNLWGADILKIGV